MFSPPDFPLISIIMPAYNAEKFISAAISSVLDQTYSNWELLIVNDGSTDSTLEIIGSFRDDRIHTFNQENYGVSASRNIALKYMKGSYFCFLDADDMFPSISLESRLFMFQSNPELTFVDGSVEKRDEKCERVLSIWTPRLEGSPLRDLLRLGGRSFLGLTWMIRRDFDVNYQMDIEISHGEDLLFLIDLSLNNGIYGFTKEKILIYRQHPDSAMRNLDKLSNGYKNIYKRLKGKISYMDLIYFKFKIRKIMFFSHLGAGEPIKALKSLI